ncbi:hypothetical protein ABZP36_035180 [Zizania latifolia]
MSRRRPPRLSGGLRLAPATASNAHVLCIPRTRPNLFALPTGRRLHQPPHSKFAFSNSRWHVSPTRPPPADPPSHASFKILLPSSHLAASAQGPPPTRRRHRRRRSAASYVRTTDPATRPLLPSVPIALMANRLLLPSKPLLPRTAGVGATPRRRGGRPFVSVRAALSASAAPAKAAGAEAVRSIRARQIVDSRGNPTVEVDLLAGDGRLHRSAVPSGASTGIYEALELRDGDKAVYGGKGVLNAVRNINDVIAPKLVGVDVRNQSDVDAIMLDLDGTLNKSKLGANSILGVSLSVCRAGAGAKGVPLYKHIQELAGTKELVMPVPAFNVINGGSHAGNNLAMQEFMLLPVGAASFAEALRMGSEEGLVLLMDAIEKAGYTGKPNDGAHVLSAQSLCDLSWASLQSSVNIQLVGDDLLVTNPKRIVEAIDKKACNALLLKVVGRYGLSEILIVVLEFFQHSSCDPKALICMLQIKTGAPCRSERLAKYNQLLRIEEELGNVRYAGEAFRSP